MCRWMLLATLVLLTACNSDRPTTSTSDKPSRQAAADAQFEYARDYRAMGQLGLALDAAQQTLTIWPDHPGAKALIAELGPQATAQVVAAAMTVTMPPLPTSTLTTPASQAPQPISTVPSRRGTREAPVAVGQSATIGKDGRRYSVVVTQVMRNANQFVQAANSFNDKPPPGQDYLLVGIRLVYEDGPRDTPWRTSNGDNRFYAQNRLWGAPSILQVPPRPTLAGQDVFPGATVEGWLPPKFLPIELMHEALLEFDGAYFALGPDTGPGTTVQAAPTPSLVALRASPTIAVAVAPSSSATIPAITSGTGASPVLTSRGVNPTSVATGAFITLQYDILNAQQTAVPVVLGGSIRPVGSTTWIDDPSRDAQISARPGRTTYTRQFLVPATAAPGVYDVAWGLLGPDMRTGYANEIGAGVLTITR